MRFPSLPKLRLLFIFLLISTTGLALLVSYKTGAHAASPQIALSQKIGHPQANVQVGGKGFGTSEAVTLTFDQAQVGTTMTDASGKFVIQMAVPGRALPGNHTIQATGQSSGLVAQASFLVRTDWAQFNFGPYRTGHNPYENVLNPSSVSGLTLDWTYPLQNAGISSPATIADGLIYFGGADYSVYALDATTGAFKWSYFTGDYVVAAPAVVNGILYEVSGGSLGVYALDAATGTLKWSFATSDVLILASPVVVNGIVYVNTAGALYALDANTGALKWSYTTPLDSIDSSPAVANGIVYVGLYDNYLYAFHATTGTMKWRTFLGTPPHYACCVLESPTVVDGVVYIGRHDGKIYAVDAATGQIEWHYSTGGIIFGAPATDHGIGIVYIGSGDHKLYALNALTGTLVWSYTTGSYIYGSPTVAGGVVYIGSADHSIYALDAATGILKWSYVTGNDILGASPVIVNGTVYVGSDKLYAFHLPGMS